MTASDFDDAIEQYHQALDDIVKGNPEGYKRVWVTCVGHSHFSGASPDWSVLREFLSATAATARESR